MKNDLCKVILIKNFALYITILKITSKLLQTKILVMDLWIFSYCWDLSDVKCFKMLNVTENHVKYFQKDNLLEILQFPKLF